MADPLKREPDKQLFTRLAGGDVEALDLIYRKYYLRLKNYGLQFAGPQWEQEVHGVVQDLFIWLAEHYYKVKKIKNPEAYLFRSVRRNLMLLQHHRRDREATRERYLRRTQFIDEESSDSPEDAFIRREMESVNKSLLHNELHQLPPYLWEALYLRYYEGLSYREIATLLSVTEQVARNYAHRAIKKLKKQLHRIDHLILSLAWLFYLLRL